MARRVLVARRGKSDQKGAKQPGRIDGPDADGQEDAEWLVGR